MEENISAGGPGWARKPFRIRQTPNAGADCVKPIMPRDDWDLIIGPIGSRRDTLKVKFEPDVHPFVHTGCFSGYLSEFDAAVSKTHGHSLIGREYGEAIAFIAKLNYLREEARAFATYLGERGPQPEDAQPMNLGEKLASLGPGG